MPQEQNSIFTVQAASQCCAFSDATLDDLWLALHEIVKGADDLLKAAERDILADVATAQGLFALIYPPKLTYTEKTA